MLFFAKVHYQKTGYLDKYAA